MLNDEQRTYITGLRVSTPGLVEAQLRDAFASAQWPEDQIKEGLRLYQGDAKTTPQQSISETTPSSRSSGVMKSHRGIKRIPLIVSFVVLLVLAGVVSTFFLKTQTNSNLTAPAQSQDTTTPTTTVANATTSVLSDRATKQALPTFTEPTTEELKNFRRLTGENLVRFYGYYAQLGSKASSEKDCDIYPQFSGYCVGGYAAVQHKPDICLSHAAKSKYFAMPMSMNWTEVSGNQRNTGYIPDGNSFFEDCFSGYGFISETNDSCENLPSPSGNNIPNYTDDKTSLQDIERESCLYGGAMSTFDPVQCAGSGYFHNICGINLAVYKKDSDACASVDAGDMRSRCYAVVVPLSGNVVDCRKIDAASSGPGVFFSNPPQPPVDKVKQAQDRCVLDYATAQKVTEKDVCNSIFDATTRNSCFTQVAINTKDIKNCTTAFVGSETNVNACKSTLAVATGSVDVCKGLADSSYCLTDLAKKMKDPSICNYQNPNGGDLKDWCLQLVGEVMHEASVCEMITTRTDRKWFCYQSLAEAKGDVEYCKKAELLGEPLNSKTSIATAYDQCVMAVTRKIKDPSSCSLVSASWQKTCIGDAKETAPN